MADVKVLAKIILRWEGGYANNKNDRGGATNKGVTIGTWRMVGYDKDGDGDIDVDDLKLITDDDAVNKVLKPYFWDKFKGDEIVNQSVANICVDWAWGSGVVRAIKKVQRILGVTADGVVGSQTLKAINGYHSQRVLFNKIKSARLQYVKDIVKNDPTQKVFLKGWINRIRSFTFSF